MSINDALKNFERLGFEGLSIREKQFRKTNKYYSIQPGSGDQFKVETGLNVRTVSTIGFSSSTSRIRSLPMGIDSVFDSSCGTAISDPGR